MATSDKPTKKNHSSSKHIISNGEIFAQTQSCFEACKKRTSKKIKKIKIHRQNWIFFFSIISLSLSLSARVCICRNARGTFIKSACIIYANPFTETEKRGGLACHSRDARTNPRETPSGLDGNSYNYVERERKRIVVCRVYCTRKEKKRKEKRKKRKREREKNRGTDLGVDFNI